MNRSTAIRMLRDSTEGSILSERLRQVRKDDGHLYYKCPCGGNDHLASRAIVFNDFGGEHGLSKFVHCYEHGMKWLVDTNPCRIILSEESTFFRLMDRFEKSGVAGRRVSADEAFRLRTEQGCPEELLDIDDIDEYRKLIRGHKEVSA